MARDIDLITSHINTDFDSLASMLAAAKLYPGALLVFPGSQERNLRNFFVESVCYFFNFVKLKDVPTTRVRRLIVVDTRQAERIGALAALASDPEVEVHLYDHHPDSEDDIKAACQLVRPLGATTTLLCQLMREKGIKLNRDEATIMALGIYEDTGNFTFTSTTPQDMLMATWLLEQGADLNIMSSLITREMNSEEVALLNDMIKSSNELIIHGIKVVIATVARASYVSDLAALVHKIMDMENLDVFFVLARMEERVHLVARSRIKQVDVGRIARILGGGGHANAASATLQEVSLSTAGENLLRLLKDNIKPTRLAQDLMTSPVIYLAPESAIEQAHEIFSRYQLNVMPVMEDDNIRGIITNRTVERALNHGLGLLPVSEYMDIMVQSVPPSATLAEVEYAIVHQRMRLLPVVENERVIGVITRTDLLRTLIDNPELPEYSPYALEKLDGARLRNVQSLLKERLSRQVNDILRHLGELAEEMDCHAYLVGGGVRDIIMRRENSDLDVVIEGDATEFARQYVKTNPAAKLKINKKFRTANLAFKDDLQIDLASARIEYYHSPAALPEVKMGSIKLDLYRRDFTINALAIHLNPGKYGTLVDFFDGLHDIKEGIIRVLHNLSFVEDPTRIFRAIRFEQRLGFKLARQTEALIKNAVKLEVLSQLSSDRLGHELRLVLSSQNPTACLLRLHEIKMLAFLHPALRIDAHQQELLYSLEDVYNWYKLSFLEEPLRPWVLFGMGLIAQLSENQSVELARRVRLAPKMLEEMLNARRLTNQAFNQLQRKNLKPSRIYNLLKDLKLEYQLFIMGSTKQEEVKKAVSNYLTVWCKVKTELNGNDIMAMGFAPGPRLAAIKERLLAARLDGEVKNKQEERGLVLKEFAAGFKAGGNAGPGLAP